MDRASYLPAWQRRVPGISLRRCRGLCRVRVGRNTGAAISHVITAVTLGPETKISWNRSFRTSSCRGQGKSEWQNGKLRQGAMDAFPISKTSR